MRFLIIATICAYAAAAPAIEPLVASGYTAPELTAARPTISAGDINGAAIEAQVEVADNLRAAIDAEQQLIDRANELRDQQAEQQGQAENQAKEDAWRAVDNTNTYVAVLDGVAAREAPVIAKNIARSSIVPVGYSAPVSKPVVTAPVVSNSAVKVSSSGNYDSEPAAYASAPVAYVTAAPTFATAAPAFATPAPAFASPAPAFASPAPVFATAAPAFSSYTAAPIRFGDTIQFQSTPFGRVYTYPVEFTQHLAYDHIF